MTKSGSELHDRLERESSRFRTMWQETEQRRRISQMLLKARLQAGISQQELASRAGWSKSYVSRVESLEGPFPGLVTIARYIDACGSSVALFVGEREDHHVVVHDIVDLRGREGTEVFERSGIGRLEYDEQSIQAAE